MHLIIFKAERSAKNHHHPSSKSSNQHGHTSIDEIRHDSQSFMRVLEALISCSYGNGYALLERMKLVLTDVVMAVDGVCT